MTNLILPFTLFCLIYCFLLEQERWVRFEQERIDEVAYWFTGVVAS